MCESELLAALAKAKPGLQIFVRTHGMVSVSLCCPPFVVGCGPTLFDAALDCARWLLDVTHTHPEYREQLPDVFAALDKFNIQLPPPLEHD